MQVRRQYNDLGLPRAGGEEKQTGRAPGFYGSEATLCATVMAATCQYTVLNPRRCTTPSVNPHVDYRPGAGRSLCTYVDRGCMGDLGLPLSFAANLELL